MSARVRTYAAQKAGLTRALRSSDPASAVRAECIRTVAEWESAEWAARYGVRQGAWPDDWSRWQRALQDATRDWSASLDDLSGALR